VKYQEDARLVPPQNGAGNVHVLK